MAKVEILLSDNDDKAILILPKSLHTEFKELEIDRLGPNGFLLFPSDDPWYPLKEAIGQMPEDFMEERNQPMLNVK